MQVKGPFLRAMEQCDNLVLVHQRSGTGLRGRRRLETSVNRAIVVIAIASWQAVVQDMTRFLLEHNMPTSTDPNYGVAKLISGQVERELGRFSTPNAENTRQLLQSVGFDPRPHWTWTNGAQGSREVVYSPAHIENRLLQWLKVRHAIAHGDERLPPLHVLEAVRQSTVNPETGPTIRLVDAKECMVFVRKLTDVTLDGLKVEFRTR